LQAPYLSIKETILKYKTTIISLRIKPTTQISNNITISTLLTLLLLETKNRLTQIPIKVTHGETSKKISFIQTQILIITIPINFTIEIKGSNPKPCLTTARIIKTLINLILNRIWLVTPILTAKAITLLTDDKLTILLIIPTIHQATVPIEILFRAANPLKT